MGCCLGRYSTSVEDLKTQAESGLPLNLLRTGDVLLFTDRHQKKIAISHVAVVVYLPSLFPNDPLMLLECVEQSPASIGQSVGEHDTAPLVDKLTDTHAISGSVRLVGLKARLKQVPQGSEVFLQFIQNTIAQLELKRRQVGGNGEAGGFNENDVLGWIHQYQATLKSNTAVGVAVDFLQYLGISDTTVPKRLNIDTIVRGTLIRTGKWRTGQQLFNLQVNK
jgi:hypothetical protein